ncbi:MAG: extracellular solute-binding protein [Sphaerochaetaceae bacterium]
MKRTLLILLVVMCLVTPIFAEGQTEKTSNAGMAKEVNVWCWDPNFNIPVMEEAASRYEAMHPDVKVIVTEMAKADVEQKIQTILASGTKTGLPDICLVEDYNVQKYVTYYPGQFTDLSMSFNYDNFADYKESIGIVNSKHYTVPFDSGVTGFFYRKDMMAKAGYSATDLQNITWDKFCDIAADYKAKTGHYMFAGDALDGGFFRVMLQSSGRWYFDKNGDPDILNNEALKEAMKIYKRMIKEDLRMPTDGWTPWVRAINEGDVASITSGIWIMGSIRAAADQSGLWDVAPTPRLSFMGSKNASNLGGSSWMVLENGPAKVTAVDFLKETFGKDVDFYQKILVEQGAMGSYIPSLTGASYTANSAFFNNKPIFKTMAAWSTQVPMVNVGLFTYDADTAVMANMQAYYNDEITIDEAIKKIDAQLRNAML